MQELREKNYCESVQQPTGIKVFRWEKVTIIHQRPNIQVYTIVKYKYQCVPAGEKAHGSES